MKLSGSEIVTQCLLREGVDAVFGLPGGANMPLYDAIYREPRLKHYLVRHEQGAALMAGGYARATGKVGVCSATSGPGGTNLVTGIADAYMDSVPLVAITGQVATSSIGTDAFQEADITGITLPIVKHNYLVRSIEELPFVIKEAFHIARSGRPGPVVIDLPKDIQVAEMEFEYPENHVMRGYRPSERGHSKMVKQAAELLMTAERPILYIGGGVISADASPEVFELATRTNTPVINSLMCKGGFPETHPLSLGMPGMHGAAYTNYAMNECDVLFAVGTRFDDRVVGKIEEFAKLAAIVHIDIDPAEIGKSVAVSVPIVGNSKTVLQQVLEHVTPRKPEAWLKRIEKWREEYPLTYEQRDDIILPQYLLETINKVTSREAIVTTDVGQHQMWAAQWCQVDYPRHFLTSGGLGTMGFGFPAALGAQVAFPEKTVVCIAGDGSFQMNMQELTMATTHKLPVVVAIFNNRYLGMVKQWQKIFFDRRYSEVDLDDNPDFVKIAEAYGAAGAVVERPQDVETALQEAVACRDKPTILDFRIEREADVYPMIPSGQSVKEMIISDAV